MGLSYKAANLDVLIISLVCRFSKVFAHPDLVPEGKSQSILNYTVT